MQWKDTALTMLGRVASGFRADGKLDVRNYPGADIYSVELPHTNPIYGDQGNRDGSFLNPTLLYDENAGSPGEYNATNEVGANFIFNSTAQASTGSVSIDATNTVDGDTMQLDNGSVPAAVALTGKIYLTSWSEQFENMITLFCWDTVAGEQMGNTVNIGDYINIATLNEWQTFAIPLSALGMGGSGLDAFRIRTEHTGPDIQAPNYYLDNINLQESGGLIYSTINNQIPNSIYYLDKFKVSTVGLFNPFELDPRDYFTAGIGELANGTTLVLKSGGSIVFTGTFRNILENSNLGRVRWIPNTYDSATGIGWADLTVDINFATFLDSSKGDYSEIIVKDDLSSLLAHTFYYGCKYEVIG